MMVGSWFYLYYKSDWVYTGVYNMLFELGLKKYALKEGVDLEKEEALHDHILHLERCLRLFGSKV